MVKFGSVLHERAPAPEYASRSPIPDLLADNALEPERRASGQEVAFDGGVGVQANHALRAFD